MFALNNVSAHSRTKGITKTAVVLSLILVILMAFVGTWYFGFLPEIHERTPEEKTSLSVEEKLTQIVERNPFENPLIPVYFHYLNRYFEGLSEDDIDLAVAGVLDDLSEDVRDGIADLLTAYTDHKEILAPKISSEFDLKLSEIIDPSDFFNKLQTSSMLMSTGTYEETPGQIRWIQDVEEFGPPVRINYVNDHWDRDFNHPVKIRPDQEVILQGYNFYSINLTVQIEDTTYYRELSGEEVFVLGDTATPADAPRDNSVRDRVYFRLPDDIPPGYYYLSVHVSPPDEYSWWSTITDRRRILVPPPSGEKYIVRAITIYCEDETNPEWWNDDETFFSFFVYSGEKKWAVVTKEYDYNDGTTKNLGPDESTLYGPESGMYTEVDGQLEIIVSGHEIDSGDVENARRIAKASTTLAADIIGAALGGGSSGGGEDGENGVSWGSIAEPLNELIDVLIGLADGEVRVADDRIIWTEDDLFFLTEVPRLQWFTVPYVEGMRHPDYDHRHFNIRGYEIGATCYNRPSGIEVRIPTHGDYSFPILPEYSERSFTVWRGYKNHGEPSFYFVLFEVQREG